MHRFTGESERLAKMIVAASLDRMKMEPPLDGPRTPDELVAQAGQTVTTDGLGGEEALRLWTDVLATACISVDHPRFLAFIPGAPTEASTMFDLLVSASSVYAGTWLEGAGAAFAENQALRWIADLAQFPPEAGGVFVQGGSVGNLSALVAARHTAVARRGPRGPGGWSALVTGETHSSVTYALERVMDVRIVRVPGDERGRMTGEAVRDVVEAMPDDERAGLFAVVATAGATNTGIVDDLAGIADAAEQYGLWMHVDGAYGGAALAAPSVRHLFRGIERADSFIVDPHKWLFAPFDSCALLYREPALARAAHTQSADYLDAVTDNADWNPSDYAVHLSRRARGLPFWFSLAAHGTLAYEEAVETTIEVARAGAEEIRRRSYLRLLEEPDLSVLVFAREGWSKADYERWSVDLLQKGTAFVTPTKHRGQPCTRFAIVNPRTTLADLRGILATMA
ncbi:MAG: pyridoxal-dependent decarboxylase [Jiangellales bacterium]